MTAAPKPLLAYHVQDDYEGHACIVFATNSATARREGASELDTEWESIDFCRREPSLDEFAPGPVPPMRLLDLGWWFECHGCSRRVELKQFDDDEPDIEPCPDGQRIYCSAACRALDRAKRRANAAAVNAMCELIYTRFREAQIVRVHVYGDRLERAKPGAGLLSTCDFRLPGLQHGVTYHFGEPHMFVSAVDAPAFRALNGVRDEVPA